MVYDPSEYEIISTIHDRCGNLQSAKVNIKGAEFTIDRLKLPNKETHIFKFRNWIAPVNGDYNNGTIEIDWDTCTSGMMKIAEDLNLKHVSHGSLFARGFKHTHFLEGGA